MSETTIRKLVEARLRVVNEVNSGKLSVSSGAKILGITRQGLWKLRKSVEKYGSSAVCGRKRLIIPKSKEKRRPVTLYAKGYPGEEIQIDTTEPFGKKGIILISTVDDCSRFGMADCYFYNNSQNAANFLLKIVREAPFPIKVVRTDNGSEFKKCFTAACKKLEIVIKRNPKHPTSNGKVERMHRTIEEECFWRVQAHKENIDYGVISPGTIPKENMEDME